MDTRRQRRADYRPVLSMILTLPLLAMASLADGSESPAWLDTNLPPAQRAKTLLAAMNATEKLVLLQGAGGPGIGNTAAIPRLGVPALRLEDGPNGVADWQTNVVRTRHCITHINCPR